VILGLLLVHSLAILIVSSILRVLRTIVVSCSIASLLLLGVLLLILLRLEGGGTGSECDAGRVQIRCGTEIQASLGLLRKILVLCHILIIYRHCSQYDVRAILT